MTWHDEREPAVYAAGERQRELEAHRYATSPKLTSEMAEAFALLEAMTCEQREFVMRCFCLGCFDRLKTGDVCHCRNDE